MRYPDEPLPEVQLSLQSFTSRAQRILQCEGVHKFLHFVLAGRLDEQGDTHRVFVNARQSVSAPQEFEYDITRDIDSAIGITRDLPFTTSLAVFPMASFSDTLKKDNHVCGPVKQQDVSA
jgi:hypothetical protein